MSPTRIQILLLLLVSLLVLPGASSKQERRAWKLLETSVEAADDPEDVFDRAREYLEKYPSGDGTIKAHSYAGRAAFELKRWKLARQHLESYLSLGGRDELDDIRLKVAIAVGKEGDVTGGMSQLANVLANAEDTQAGRTAGRELVAQLLFEGDWRRTLTTQGTMLERGFFEPELDIEDSKKAISVARREIKSRGRTWGKDGWSRTEKSFEEPTVRGLLAALALEEDGRLLDSVETESDRRAWASRFPEHPLVDWVPGASVFMAEDEDVNPDVVGLLIPETGKYAAPGELVRRGVQLALMKAAEQGWPQVDLRIVDTAGDAVTAEAGMRRLVEEDKAIAVLGPMISAEAEQLAPLTSELAMPTVMLSQRPGFEADNPYAFNGWIHPESQVRALVDHAIHRMGLQTFAIAYPAKESAGGLARRFWEEVEAQGGKVVSVESYPAQETDFRETAQRLIGTYWEEKVPGEGDVQLPYMPGRSKPQLADEGAKVLEPGLDFQAVFVPDNYRRVSMLAPGFLFEEINLGGHIEKVPSVVLLGGSALNHPDLVNRGGDYIKGTVLVDGFFLEANRDAVLEFKKAYRANYNADPTLLEASAYDATLFLCQLLSEGVTSRRSLLQRLSLASPMITVTGARGFEPGGAMQHEMLTLQVRKGKIVQVWPTTDTGE
ncbi:MAG: penicillin-binding protein activator [Deltaproteobacteria bacterium]|nr:penicillin-binding protein activator [Deltaproteobacteria bacterium]